MLASMLCEVLSDWELTCWDRKQLDITNQEDVFEKVIEERPEVIINAAAYTDVDGAENEGNRDVCFGVNEVAVKNIALVAKN